MRRDRKRSTDPGAAFQKHTQVFISLRLFLLLLLLFPILTFTFLSDRWAYKAAVQYCHR